MQVVLANFGVDTLPTKHMQRSQRRRPLLKVRRIRRPIPVFSATRSSSLLRFRGWNRALGRRKAAARGRAAAASGDWFSHLGRTYKRSVDRSYALEISWCGRGLRTEWRFPCSPPCSPAPSRAWSLVLIR